MMCNPYAVAAYAVGLYAKNKAQADAYRRASEASAAALAHQMAWQNKANQLVQGYVQGMNVGQRIADQRQRSQSAITAAMQQASAAPRLVAPASGYAQRLAQDRAQRNRTLAEALAAMQGWRNYASQSGIERARLAQQLGTIANFAQGQAAVDRLAVKAASIPNQDLLTLGGVATDIGMALAGR